jgi:hypothetical protein
MLQEGRVGHHGQIRAVQFKAHVDLLGDAGQQLRQGLVDGVQGDVAVMPGWMSTLTLASRARATAGRAPARC